MTDSLNLITAQITFLDTHLVLVHIPNEYYPFFAQPILRALFGEDCSTTTLQVPWTERHDFLNLSITPIGCSLICSTALVNQYFRPLVDQFNALLTNTKFKNNPPTIEISDVEYTAIQVEGQGLDAGQRVVELTGPLSMAGISILFVTSYFCDYVLIPVKCRHVVATILQQRGFVFSEEIDAYVSPLSPSMSHSHYYERPQSASSNSSDGRPRSQPAPMTPPAKDVPELQIRTFTKLLKQGIEPMVNPQIRLVSCAARRESSTTDHDKLKNDLIQVLLSAGAKPMFSVTKPEFQKKANTTLATQDLPLDDAAHSSVSFLSITLSEEPISIFMEEWVLPRLGSTLLCSKGAEDILVPLILDLRSLDWTTTGIVGGVAGRLGQGPASVIERLGADKDITLENMGIDGEVIEISFLSSAKAGSVLVRADQLDRVMEAFMMGIEEVKGRK